MINIIYSIGKQEFLESQKLMLMKDNKILEKIYHPPLPNQFIGRNGSLSQNSNLRRKPVNSDAYIEKLLTLNNFQEPINLNNKSATLNKNNIHKKFIQSIQNVPILQKLSYADPVIHHNIIKLPDIQSITEKLEAKVNLNETEKQKSKF